jgi:DHA2 family methylenomycin A resistance protein-like MFS transporter
MAAGPVLGGVLIAAGGWRLTFLVNVPLAAAGSAAILAWLPADDQERAPRTGPACGCSPAATPSPSPTCGSA